MQQNIDSQQKSTIFLPNFPSVFLFYLCGPRINEHKKKNDHFVVSDWMSNGYHFGILWSERIKSEAIKAQRNALIIWIKATEGIFHSVRRQESFELRQILRFKVF